MGTMPKNHVPDLVRHYTGDLRLVICCVDSAAIDVNETARQSERIDCGVVHYFELERILFARSMCGELPPKAIDVGRGLPVVQYLQLAFRLPRGLSSHFDVLLCRKKIEARLEFGSRICGVCGERDCCEEC